MRKRNRRKLRLFYITTAILIFALGISWWVYNIQPVKNGSETFQTFTIEKGKSLRKIATDLKSSQLIRNEYTFILTTKLLGIDDTVQAGDFELSPKMNTVTIAKTLTRSTTDIRVTFPEGKRAEEVAEILTNHIPTLNIDDIIPLLSQNEGYLFPDTYNFEKNESIEDIINKMKSNFNDKYETISPTSSLSQEEIVTIASMIEREARHNEDRKLVASVIHNRLNIGMKLDIDATVQYALGFDPASRTWWKNGLSTNDLSIDSDYNTYTNPGLPPSPISNPGVLSLQAASNPSNTDYLYYFTDKNGVNHYSRTLNEQNSNIRIYGL